MPIHSVHVFDWPIEQSRQCLVGLVRVDAKQIGEELVLGVRPGEHRSGRVVRAAEIARVPAVAASELARRALDDEDARRRPRAR